ncbi:hypothetical protein BDV96DRAFT_654803 [Lophiotrema nucula]|uniref:Uncharacterized protein n=1 Tax=Lophiotrema nucula TaxID=690887 RepID=A0A6A5YHJ6_9PLEO|nr:hypothetical protein BDV96DRAFT_654803 [Lophiotrema nucula]
MSANDIEVLQPAQGLENEETIEVFWSDEEIPEHERTKSNVDRDANAPRIKNKFAKDSHVHTSRSEGGMQSKVNLTVYKARYNASRGFYEYQLVDDAKRPYKNGAWIREKDLRIETKR